VSRAEKAAAAAYAEYCYRVYSTDQKWADWAALPAYLRRAWMAAVDVAVSNV